jgi:hypothetical protein
VALLALPELHSAQLGRGPSEVEQAGRSGAAAELPKVKII